MAQVRQLQEELDHRVHSVASRDTNSETCKLQQPNLSENGPRNHCCNGEESKPSPPDDVLNIAKTTWDVIDIIKNQDLLVQVEMPDFPTQEKLTSQGGPFSSQASGHSGSLLPEEAAEPQQDPVRALDLSSWSSPEVVRKDPSLEPQHSLPLTPGVGTVSLHSVDISPDWTDPLLQADVSGLLCYPGKSASGQAPLWAVAPSAGKHHAERTATVGVSPYSLLQTFVGGQCFRRVHHSKAIVGSSDSMCLRVAEEPGFPEEISPPADCCRDP
jgi:pericentrin